MSQLQIISLVKTPSVLGWVGNQTVFNFILKLAAMQQLFQKITTSRGLCRFLCVFVTLVGN